MVIFVSLCSLAAMAQDDLPIDGESLPGKKKHKKDHSKNSLFTDRLFTGGDLGVQFGSITAVNVSPILGYWITKDKFAAGVGATYQYFNYKSYNFTTSIYGGNLFSRYYFGESFFAHGEYELLNVEAFDGFHERVFVPGLLAGGGYRQDLGERASFVFMLLYNFSESYYTPYRNPVIRAGVNIGI
jgi:hypothetical protein